MMNTLHNAIINLYHSIILFLLVLILCIYVHNSGSFSGKNATIAYDHFRDTDSYLKCGNMSITIQEHGYVFHTVGHPSASKKNIQVYYDTLEKAALLKINSQEILIYYNLVTRSAIVKNFSSFSDYIGTYGDKDIGNF